MLEIHARALCAHCECLALNAANMYSVIHDDHPPYHQGHYQEILEKWNLINRAPLIIHFHKICSNIGFFEELEIWIKNCPSNNLYVLKAGAFNIQNLGASCNFGFGQG